MIAALVERLPKHTDFANIFASVLESVPLSADLAAYAGDALLEHYIRRVAVCVYT